MTRMYIVKKKQVFEVQLEVEAESREHAEALAGEMDIPTDRYEQVLVTVSAKPKAPEPYREAPARKRVRITIPQPNGRAGKWYICTNSAYPDRLLCVTDGTLAGTGELDMLARGGWLISGRLWREAPKVPKYVREYIGAHAAELTKLAQAQVSE